MTSDEASAHVSPDRIKLEFDPASPLDLHTRDIDARVEARAFPGWLANERERAGTILGVFQRLLGPDVSLSVFVMFYDHATYREYTP